MKTKLRIAGLASVLMLISMSVQADVLRNSAPGNTVTYTTITESLSNTGAGSFTGTYGTPNVNNDQLVFSAVNLESAASDGNYVKGDAQLNFTVEAHEGFSIDEIRIGEAGDGSLDEIYAAATSFTKTSASATLQVLIEEVDNAPYYGPYMQTSGTFASFSAPIDLGIYQWQGQLVLDIEQLLTDSGYEHQFGATKLTVTLDNFLWAYSQPGTEAIIKKKGANGLAVTAVSVPEPASVAMLIGTTTGLVFIRRRFIA